MTTPPVIKIFFTTEEEARAACIAALAVVRQLAETVAVLERRPFEVGHDEGFETDRPAFFIRGRYGFTVPTASFPAGIHSIPSGEMPAPFCAPPTADPTPQRGERRDPPHPNPNRRSSD